MRPYKNTLMLAALAGCFTLTACQTTSPLSHAQTKPIVTPPFNAHNSPVININQRITQNTLTNGQWSLISATDGSHQPINSLIKAKNNVTLNFNNHNNRQALNFTVGCNNHGADYSLSNHTLSTDMIIATEMFCADLDDAEKRLAALMRKDSQLTLIDGGSKVLKMQFADGTKLEWRNQSGTHLQTQSLQTSDLKSTLQKYNWTLINAMSKTAYHSKITAIPEFSSTTYPVTLNFEVQNNKHIVSYVGGCNRHTGAYQLTDGNMQTNTLMATRRACDPKTEQAESMVNGAMKNSKLKLSLANTNSPILEQDASNPYENIEMMTLRWQGMVK